MLPVDTRTGAKSLSGIGWNAVPIVGWLGAVPEYGGVPAMPLTVSVPALRVRRFGVAALPIGTVNDCEVPTKSNT